MAKKKLLAPDEFAEKMKKISAGYDTEGAHCEADDLMCEVLSSLGYGEGVKIYSEMQKWYA